MWASTNGEYILDIDAFISDLQQSFKNFTHAMETQVQSVLDNPINNEFLDKNRLHENHNEFLEEIKSYDNVLSFVLEQISIYKKQVLISGKYSL